MSLAHKLALCRNKPIWRDPVRRHLTLQSFSETEEDGGKDLELAIPRVIDEELRGHLIRHAADERRHAEMFRRRAADLREQAGGETAGRDARGDHARGLLKARGADTFEAHGSFNAGICEELGEVAYVAMLHVAEKRAAEVFAIHSELNHHDPQTRAIFEEILKDEKYHVSYTGKMLERFRAAGRGNEVDQALKDARGSRALGAWKRLGVKSGAGFSRVVLYLLYWTLAVPFGLLARRGSFSRGWSEPASPRSLREQY